MHYFPSYCVLYFLLNTWRCEMLPYCMICDFILPLKELPQNPMLPVIDGSLNDSWPSHRGETTVLWRFLNNLMPWYLPVLLHTKQTLISSRIPCCVSTPEHLASIAPGLASVWIHLFHRGALLLLYLLSLLFVSA